MSALTLEWRGKVRIAIIIRPEFLGDVRRRLFAGHTMLSPHRARIDKGNSCASSKDFWSMTPFMFPTIGKPLPAANAETVMNPEAKAFQVFSSSHSGPKRQPRTSSWQKINTTSMRTKHCFLLFRNRGLYLWVEYYTLQTILTGDISLGKQRNISEAKKEITTIRALLQTTATYDHDLYFYAKCNCEGWFKCSFMRLNDKLVKRHTVQQDWDIKKKVETLPLCTEKKQ